MSKITGIITTLNEEAHIADCIASLKTLCDEIIVVDSNSTDKTVEIAQSMGAKTFVQSYLGDGPQKNYGLQFASNNWVFSLDADERLTPEIIEEINSLKLTESKFDGYAVKRKNLIGSRWIKVCGWYPDFFVRLYNKNQTRFSDKKGHARVTSENIQPLNNQIIHYSYKNCGELFSKGHRFSSRGAKMLLEKGKVARFYSPFFHGGLAFVKKYIFKLGFIGGVDGFTVSLSAGVNSYLKWAKLLEFQTDPIIKQSLTKEGLW